MGRMKFDRSKMIEALNRVILRMHYPLEVMLVYVCWYAAYPNLIVEQDYRSVKRVVRPMLGFKSFRCARILVAGIDDAHDP